MPYKTTRDVHFDGRLIAAGKTITFTDSEDHQLAREQLLALDPPAILGSGAKPLERMSKPELLQVIADEAVEVAAEATNAQMIEAITAKREIAAQS